MSALWLRRVVITVMSVLPLLPFFFFFFFNDTATTEIYTLSLHDALPISRPSTTTTATSSATSRAGCSARPVSRGARSTDRKSTRLNSSHANISYAVFCLKKKKKNNLENDIRGDKSKVTEALLQDDQ